MLTFLKAIELIKIMPDGSFQIIGYGIQSFLTLLKDGWTVNTKQRSCYSAWRTVGAMRVGNCR